MFNELFAHIRRFVPLSPEDEALMQQKLTTKSFKKKAFLLEPGNTCRYNYFVSKGLLRMYFINMKGLEQITHFGLENWWLTDFASFETQQLARFYIQALEDTDVVAWDAKTQEELIEAIPQLEKYFRKMLQRAYAASQRRIEFIYGMTDEERYRSFSSLFPDFLQRVPQYMLASYLGFTPQFLSKIRARVARGD